MPNVAEQLTSLDEFVAWERDQPERYEYAGGVITMMTGGSGCPRHDRDEPCLCVEARLARNRLSSFWQ